jgi:predicted Zn-dependent peptidase|tara:strand:- start:1224 stop:1490 length:267 start_codon:yes stop_codon:yes gene_type:complete
MLKKFVLIIVLSFFVSSQAQSNSCPVLYPELMEMLENSTLPQEKVDEARALIEQGWALHKELEDTPDDSRHYDALELLFQALDILEAT